jgi:hypothetical protein
MVNSIKDALFWPNVSTVRFDYKRCEQLHKFICKKVIATQKLNALFLRMRAKNIVLLFTMVCF